MADIVLSVTSKVAEYLVAPVCRRCGYVIFPNSYFRQLKNELKKLHVARDRVQRSIDEAEYNGKQIERDVKNWVQGVEIVTNKARDVLEYDGRAKKTCFCGWLPNPKVRYCLGREARRRIEEIQKLIASGGFEVHFVVDSDGNTIFWSRAPILADIMNALNDEKFKVIGIHGPRGVGKTTLLEEVQEKLRNEKRLFDLIVTTTVSRSPDLKNIQDSIAYALSLDLKNEPSEVRRRDLLFQKLQSDPTKEVLIILDDLWGELDLKAVGIPLGDESRGCKLLLTSSFKDVLEQKMLADRTFTLEGLKDEEAFRLFEKMVGDRLKSNEELKAIAARVVKRLGGLPLLITSVASTLKFGSVSAWKNVLTKIDELNTKTIVKLSYDLLENEDAKSLFLLCGLIGGTIQVETLLGLCVGLGLFERFNSTIQHSRDRLKAMIDSLRSLCLLQDGGDDKENVTIHDLYNFRYMKELQVLYLRSMHITTLPSSIKILRNLQSLNLDFCNMEDVAILGKLEALQILSFAGSTIYRLPKEIGELTNLRSLNLSNCKELHIIEPGVLGRLINLEEFLAELKSLTKLTTLEISIRDPIVLFNDGDLPFGNLIKFWISIGVVDGREFEGLRNMKLKLGECNSIILEEWVQKSLQKTQYLHLDGLREFDKNAHDLCTRGFSQLKHLDILNSPSIEYIASSSHPLLLIEFTILESLFIENLINLKKICHGPIAQECFSKLKAVHIKRCHLLKNLWFLSEMQGLVHLEEIQVHECDSMEAIITYDARIIEVAADDIVELPNVRHLDLRMLPNMTGFCIGAKRAPIQVTFLFSPYPMPVYLIASI
ncbi:hypothetical protein EUGRSUZ_G01356 [Eucalyptus grandis]|uniref:Uncharacterized protein n=2 Tax=Eucalyptus grandis TaxID=71139 RepID=A0ACC3K224_EUCGR|nr:hypothetical protein EUGRSUZ_G01356 [Eucalyptus grandis]